MHRIGERAQTVSVIKRLVNDLRGKMAGPKTDPPCETTSLYNGGSEDGSALVSYIQIDIMNGSG